MTDNKYPLNAETGLPALPEGYRWFVENNHTYGDFNIIIQKEHDTEIKFVVRPRNAWEKFTLDHTRRGEHKEITLRGEERWKNEMTRTILTITALVERELESKTNSGSNYVKDIARILDPETILENAKILVKKFDEKRRAKESEKYVGAYPPRKLNSD